jgi:very-short-patch-repair endonuclease
MVERSMFYGASPEIFKRAKMLRDNETKAEKLLWQHLRNNRLGGYRFKRQHPISNYIADFYCHKCKLVIEVDEEYHLRRDQRIKDEIKTDTIIKYGLTVLRFTDEEVCENIEMVLKKVNGYLKPEN